MSDIIITINTYNRFDSLIKLLNQLLTQNNSHKINIVVCDDSSDDIRYVETNFFKENNIKLIKTDVNNGKMGYWKTINLLMLNVKNFNFDFLIQLDDDFEICDNFIDLCVDFFKSQLKLNNTICAMSLHLNGVTDGTSNRWGCGNSWVDGGAIYTKKIIETLNYEVMPINKNRWQYDKKLSSGVWQQISCRINRYNLSIIKPNYSFLKHNNNNISKMNHNESEKRLVTTYNFIGDEQPNDLDIFKINKNVIQTNKTQKQENIKIIKNMIIKDGKFLKKNDVRIIKNMIIKKN
jgi:hypothetical protein